MSMRNSGNTSYSPQVDTSITVCLYGDSSVGKTSIINKYTNDEFVPYHTKTIGIDYRLKRLKVEGRSVRLQIWDTAGEEKHYAIGKNTARKANAIVLV